MEGDAKPRSLDEFGCWVNEWAGLPKGCDRTWKSGYEQAVSDIAKEFARLYPDWPRATDAWVKYRTTVATADRGRP